MEHDDYITIFRTHNGSYKQRIPILIEQIKNNKISDGELNKPDYFGETMLINVCNHANSHPLIPELVEAIILRRVDVNHEGEIDGTTALFYASRNNDEKVIALLKKYGADPNKKRKPRFTAEEYEMERAQIEAFADRY